jgi:hypothetical protein
MMDWAWMEVPTRQVTAHQVLKRWFNTVLQASAYFVYDARYYELFACIEASTLHPGLGRDVVDILLGLDINVKRLSSTDLPRLLERTWLDSQNKERIGFLEMIWTFVNREGGYQPEVFFRLPVYHVKTIHGDAIVTPETFDKMPAVLTPAVNTAEIVLCEKIPGLGLVQETTFPRSMVRQETLQSAKGLMRFTRALSLLAFKAHRSLEAYLQEIFNEADLGNLRHLYIAVLSKLGDSERMELQSMMSLLCQLPLWKNVHGKLVPAASKILLPHPQLFLPWLTICERFLVPTTEPSFTRALRFLGVGTPDAAVFLRQYIVPNIRQHKLREDEVAQYNSFLTLVFELLPAIPSDWPFACDGNLNFRRIGELHDHSNPFFQASLRGNEKERFLHEGLQRCWERRGGLRTEIAFHDYVAAAKQIQVRGLLDNHWKENLQGQLHADAQTIYRMLCSNWNSLQSDSSSMQTLLRICFIPTKRGFLSQPRFRNIRMQSLANRRPFNCFRELLLAEYVDVCWSQVRKPLSPLAVGSS